MFLRTTTIFWKLVDFKEHRTHKIWSEYLCILLCKTAIYMLNKIIFISFGHLKKLHGNFGLKIQ